VTGADFNSLFPVKEKHAQNIDVDTPKFKKKSKQNLKNILLLYNVGVILEEDCLLK